MAIELMLTQLKFINHLANGTMVCEKVLDTLEMASNHTRQVVIHNIADIIDMTHHNEIMNRIM